MNYFANNEINISSCHVKHLVRIAHEFASLWIKGQLWIRDLFALTFWWCSRSTTASALAIALNNFSIHWWNYGGARDTAASALAGALNNFSIHWWNYGGARDTLPPGSIFFIFMQFSGKIGPK